MHALRPSAGRLAMSTRASRTSMRTLSRSRASRGRARSSWSTVISGEAIAITLWDDEQALRASEEAASALRADAAGQMGASDTPNVGRYEVAVFEI
jgi:hypothetical protein